MELCSTFIYLVLKLFYCSIRKHKQVIITSLFYNFRLKLNEFLTTTLDLLASRCTSRSWSTSCPNTTTPSLSGRWTASPRTRWSRISTPSQSWSCGETCTSCRPTSERSSCTTKPASRSSSWSVCLCAFWFCSCLLFPFCSRETFTCDSQQKHQVELMELTNDYDRRVRGE